MRAARSNILDLSGQTQSKGPVCVALIAYLLIQILRFTIKTSISIADAMAVVGTLLLLKEPLTRLLGDLPRVTRHPQDLQIVLNL